MIKDTLAEYLLHIIFSLPVLVSYYIDNLQTIFCAFLKENIEQILCILL